MSQSQGFAAERMARDYLIRQGLRFRESNYRSRLGEIDLIMQDKQYLVFIEVRMRSSKIFGGAIDSITYAKRQKIIKTASCYLQRYALHEQFSSRFDVVTMEGQPPDIQWIPNAFGMDY